MNLSKFKAGLYNQKIEYINLLIYLFVYLEHITNNYV